MKSLCSHGGLLCRRRGLETLFPSAGSAPMKAVSQPATCKSREPMMSELPDSDPAAQAVFSSKPRRRLLLRFEDSLNHSDRQEAI